MVYYTCLWAVANTLVPWTFQPSVWPMHSTELLLHVISLFIQISPSVAISALLLGNRQCHTQPLPLNGQWYLVSIIKCDESSLRANWDSSFQMHPSLLWSIFHHNTFYNQWRHQTGFTLNMSASLTCRLNSVFVSHSQRDVWHSKISQMRSLWKINHNN